MNGSKSQFAMNFSVFLLMLGVGMVSALLPGQVTALGGSMANTGWLASAFAITFLLIMLPMGRLADRIGAKPLIVAGYFFSGLAGLIYFAAGSAAQLLLGRMLHGLGEAPVWALAPAFLALLQPIRTGVFLGRYNASLHLGLTLGPFAGILLNPWLGARGQFLCFCLLCWAGGVIIAVLAKNLRASKGISAGAAKLADLGLMQRPSRPLLLLGVLLYGASYGLCLTILPPYLAESKSFSYAQTGLYFSLLYLGLSLSQLAAGYLSLSRHVRGISAGGMLVAGGGFMLLPWLPHKLVLLILPPASLGLGVFAVCSLTRMNAWAAPQAKGLVSGLYYLVWGLGYSLVPFVWHWLVMYWEGFEGVWLGFAACLLLHGLISAPLGRTPKA